MRQRKRAAAVIAAALFAMAACAKGNETQLAQKASDSDAVPAELGAGDPGSGGTGAVYSADTELGEILVDANGMTLYGFANDADGQSACYSTCAEAWPPLTVSPEWRVGAELDSAIFNTHERDDGTEQLVAGPWPLYRYAEDTAPGDIKGQGSGGVWYVVSAEDGTLIQDDPGETEDSGVDSGEAEHDHDANSEDVDGGVAPEAAPDVQVASTHLGEVLTDAQGFTLYGLTRDTDGCPTCTGDCAGTWPALLAEEQVTLAEGLDPSTFTTVEGAEGGTQVVAGDWPLYRFSGDSSPGDVNGQGVDGVWFAVAPDGSLIDAGGQPSSDGMGSGGTHEHMDHGMDGTQPPDGDSYGNGGY